MLSADNDPEVTAQSQKVVIGTYNYHTDVDLI
jgi:hypothetical protein